MELKNKHPSWATHMLLLEDNPRFYISFVTWQYERIHSDPDAAKARGYIEERYRVHQEWLSTYRILELKPNLENK